MEYNNDSINETILEVRDLEEHMPSKFKKKMSSLLDVGKIGSAEFQETDPDFNELLSSIQAYKEVPKKTLSK
jgi:hypothetical protein